MRTSRPFVPAILAAALLHAVTALAAPPAEPPTGLTITPDPATTLVGKDARQQFVVTGTLPGGALRDLTRAVQYEADPADIVQIDETGFITPLADGAVTVTAKGPNGLTASTRLAIERFDNAPPINFPNQIVPIFTKVGCNSGGCHGKSEGQNGFRLSLLGFEPAEDYEHLVRESRGRRLFPAAPDRSLLLRKVLGTVPHGGGQRIEKDSHNYRLIRRWIAQGMPYGSPDDPVVERIEVFPTERIMREGQSQQLQVTALYSDGSREDVTRTAQFEANEKEMAEVAETGLVTVAGLSGDVAVMIRYQGQVAVFRATIPLGAPVAALPKPVNFIDEEVFRKLEILGMPPSDLCDDVTFVRRTAIDIAGRLPTPDETKAFAADPDSAKRDKWIDKLLASGDYADYFANKWSAILRNKRRDDRYARGTYAFHSWIRHSLYTNKPYDRFVREIVVASGEIGSNPPVAWYREVKTVEAQLEDTAQLFLGTRIQCARCHHHPFEKWSQNDYYGFAAFFSRVKRKPGARPGEEIVYHQRGNASARNPKNGQDRKPAGFGGPSLELDADQDPRHALADWMAETDNPFFAHVLVNRYWKHFFSRGLVEPEDDLRMTNPATNPTLLEALARHFVGSGFDLKDLVRTICRSQVYQRSSFPNEYNAKDKQNFSRFYPKRLPAEVLLDAINQVTNATTKFPGQPNGVRAVQLPDNSFNSNSYFLTVFGRPDMASACECERTQDASLAQSLHLLNSQEMHQKLTAGQGRAATLAAAKERSDDDKLTELYYWAFSRAPDADEQAKARQYLDEKRSDKEAKGNEGEKTQRAYEDILWALLNSKEFLFNH